MSLEPARTGPYTDSNITFRNPPAQTIVPTPAKSGPTTLGGVTVYDVAGTNHNPVNRGAVSPANAPTAWKAGRDPYANNGMVGQDFFKNQSSSSPAAPPPQ